VKAGPWKPSSSSNERMISSRVKPQEELWENEEKSVGACMQVLEYSPSE
jgi:hypothetical protein